MNVFNNLVENLSLITQMELEHARHGRWEEVIRHEEAKSTLLLEITTHAAAAAQGEKLIMLFSQSMSDLIEIEKIMDSERQSLSLATPAAPWHKPYRLAICP